MTYTDSKGRPEIIAQSFISKGNAGWRAIAEADDREHINADSDAVAGVDETGEN